MAERRLKIDLVDVDALSDDVRRASMAAVANLVRKYARRRTPMSKGKALRKDGVTKRTKLRQSIGTRVSKDGKNAVVYAKAPHARIIHDGTKAHQLIAKGHHANIGGHWVTGPIMHPGQPGVPYLVQGAEDARSEVPAVLKGVAEKIALRKAAK